MITVPVLQVFQSAPSWRSLPTTYILFNFQCSIFFCLLIV
nr:MAG TPA: hypothetical protein [Caudoviricetes sp.]